ncbi:hypothetical protein CMUST_01240 [Corynebacterium mustelae]|uniref:Uncharacterized protein n=1 Tax=Corynebacterium mustelae TaxID=571915 RepID=A0A0G3H0H1_9CORY|nr:hypothetical protein [Corynebacterium mustelae]AKK04597.1 hypothetical protein CMUST_01240 [Corynebacterium mustelae]
MSEKPTTTVADRFEEFRARAVKSGKFKGLKQSRSVTDEPFVLGEEYGFINPIEIEKPNFSTRQALADAAVREDLISMLKILMKDDFGKWVMKMDEAGDEAEFISAGLVIAVIEHFYGPGFLEAAGFSM